ncbi:Gas vesicle structural protein [Streptomyces sp. SudanB5_2050]|uniref:gas vesicle protein n=1 Tax=Streptomyces sp. SudanB5_2050 TaxID=3035274 RepID=UPI0036DA94FD
MSSFTGRTTPSEGRFPAAAPGHDPAARTVPAVGAAPMQPRRDGEGSLAHVVETLLDKGLVLNADIMVSVAGVELLGIRLRAALASFETAARYGLEFPSGTDTETAAWRETREERETCPACGKRVPVAQLLDQWCPWCGWRSAQSRLRDDSGQAALTAHSAADDPANGEADDAPDQAGADREAERRGQ